MKAGKWFLLLILIAFSMPASAEFYKYVDRDGHVRYTDDLSMVPEDQRPNVKKYVESKSRTSEIQGETPKEGTGQSPGTSAEPGNQETEDELMEMKHRLDEKKVALEKEREGLEKEKAAIDREQEELTSSKRYKMERGKQSPQTRNKIKEINSRVAALNDKLKVFEQNRAAYETDEAAFSEQLNRALGK